MESAAYFVAAEALANAAKHARARRVDITIVRADDLLDLEVDDDGVGGANPEGSGLRGLRRRVEALDGTLSVISPTRRTDADSRRAAMRVVIAEDLALLRDGMTRLLRDNEIEVVAAVGDGEALVREVVARSPTSPSSTSACRRSSATRGCARRSRSARRVPGTAVLVISQYVEQSYAEELLADRGGGIGYLLKDRVMHVVDFLEAVRRVADGGTALDPEVVAQLFQRRREDGPLERLTPREREVLELMAEGRSNAGIAKSLVLTVGAVEKHVQSILSKLDLPQSATDHRRVLAVLAYLQQQD